VALSSVASLFPRDRFYLFFGAADRLEIVRGPIAFSGADHLLPVKVNAPPPVSAAVSKEGLPPIEIPIRLIPTLSPPRRVVASLVDWSEAARLKQLVYVLPPPVLRGHEIALTDRGLLLLCREGVDVLPLGALLTEAAPGLLIPLGMDVTPRVPTEVLGAAIEHQLAARSAASASQARITVFPHDGAPSCAAGSALRPPGRGARARIRVPRAASVAEPVAAGEPSTRIVNDAVGRFALWGFPKPPSE